MRWIIAAVVILLTALLLRSGLLAFAMYVLLGVIFSSRLLAKNSLNHISARRSVPRDEFDIGETIDVNVAVRNDGPWPIIWLLMEDRLPETALKQRPPRLKIKRPRIKLASLRALGSAQLKYTLDALRRGYFTIGPLDLHSGDLFGLYRTQKTATKARHVLVLPAVLPVPGYDIASRRPIGDIRLTMKLFEDPTRIAGVRPYEPGDSLNRIHWRATARTGALHSKVYEPTTLTGATVLIDFHSSGYPARGEPIRSDLAVTIAISLANAVSSVNQPIGLATNAHDAAKEEGDRAPLIVPTRRGPEQVEEMRRLLARAEPQDGQTFDQFVIEVLPRLPRDSSVIAVLPAVSVETAMALGTLRRLGFAVTAVLAAVAETDLAEAAGRLITEGIRDIRPVVNESAVPFLCGLAAARTPYQLA